MELMNNYISCNPVPNTTYGYQNARRVVISENVITTFFTVALWNLEPPNHGISRSPLRFLVGLVSFMRNIEDNEFDSGRQINNLSIIIMAHRDGMRPTGFCEIVYLVT
jgi:hypothetical protein